MNLNDLSYREICDLFSDKKRFVEMWNRHHKIVKSYRYLVTFTIDPKKQPKPDYDEIEAYITKQFTQRKPLKVTKAFLVREGGDDGKHVHWHVALETEKSLTKDRFNYYSKIFGNIDFSPTKSQNLEETVEYISKSNIPKQIK